MGAILKLRAGLKDTMFSRPVRHSPIDVFVPNLASDSVGFRAGKLREALTALGQQRLTATISEDDFLTQRKLLFDALTSAPILLGRRIPGQTSSRPGQVRSLC